MSVTSLFNFVPPVAMLRTRVSTAGEGKEEGRFDDQPLMNLPTALLPGTLTRIKILFTDRQVPQSRLSADP